MASQEQNMLARYRRRQGRLYRLLRPPAPLLHNSQERSLPWLEGVKLFIGGAGGLIPAGFVNVDMSAVPGVDISADLQRFPFRDGSVAAIECDAVLEHVPDPAVAVTEMRRVLKPGGYLHIVVPFCHPFHGYPSDFNRWSDEGIRRLLKDFEILDVGVRTGAAAALLAFILEYSKVLLPGTAGRVAYVLLGWLLWPLRYMDLISNRTPRSEIMANHLYALARKR